MRTFFAVIGIVFAALLLGVCVACIDDDSEENSMQFVSSSERPPGCGPGGNCDGEDEQSNNENGNDCYQAETNCSDDDFSPSFDKSPVEDSFNPTICLPFSECSVPNHPSNDEEGPEPSSR